MTAISKVPVDTLIDAYQKANDAVKVISNPESTFFELYGIGG